MTDPELSVHAYQYDDFDRLETAIDPHSRETKYEYDEVGNLTKKIDRRGTIRDRMAPGEDGASLRSARGARHGA